jgi:hypothetical protein
MIGRVTQLLQTRLHGLAGAPAAMEILRRDAPGGLQPPGLISPNRHCHLIAAREGWLAVNLARQEDRDVISALTGARTAPEVALAARATSVVAAALVCELVELHLPTALVGEAQPMRLSPIGSFEVPRRVLDMSALWAGPLCSELLRRAGANVIRIDSLSRPDPTPQASPQLHRFLSGDKQVLALDLRTLVDRQRLLDEITVADVLITSGRPAALARLGLTPESVQAVNPWLRWTAITAHGFTGTGSERVGFGDDCAAAGGLLRWRNGQPYFAGDALADPLTGVEAALATLAAPVPGLIDVPMAGTAAAYAALAYLEC